MSFKFGPQHALINRVARGMPPEATMCVHYECKCALASQLAAMGRTAEAVEVHSMPGRQVRCRMGGRYVSR